MDKATLQKLKDAIGRSNSIGIAVGREPSVDEMGAALSLYLLLKNANKKVSVASPTDPIVEISSLVGINKVQRQFGGDAGDLVVSFPYKEGEIEKVSYTLDEQSSLLNIIVKASAQGLSFDEQDVKFTRGSGTIDLLITVGAASLADLGDVFDEQKFSNITVINIDNKQNNQGFGDIVLVSPQASSVSEHVADIVLTLGFTVEQDSAQNLLSGIMSATRNFQDPKTSSLAFEVASFLMKHGARRMNGQQPQRNEQPQQRGNQSQQQPPAPRQQQQQTEPQQRAQQPAPQQQPRQQQPQQNAQQQQQQSPAPAQTPKAQQPVQTEDQQDDAPPLDWLTPKVYKGSSDV